MRMMKKALDGSIFTSGRWILYKEWRGIIEVEK